MILTDADELREALRVALQERDEARAEVERLRFVEDCRGDGLTYECNLTRPCVACRLRTVAERQREACAERFRPSKAALVFYKRREAEEIVRSTPLVTDTKADGGTP